MCGTDKQLLDEVLLAPRHSADAAAAAPLRPVCVDRLALEISKVCQRNHAVLNRNQILDIDLPADSDNLCAALVCVFGAQDSQFLLDDRHHTCIVA